VNINEGVIFTKEIVSKYENKHDEKGFWEKIKKVGTKIGVTPIYLVFLLYHSLMSKSISIAAKAPIAGALGYFISLVDIVPDLTPVIGYCDDMSIVVGALGVIATQITEEIRWEAKNSTRKIFPNITDEEFIIIDKMYNKSAQVLNDAKSMKENKHNIRTKSKNN